jgi:two-component system phosphate regulon sensor histidine kinase PhoR
MTPAEVLDALPLPAALIAADQRIAAINASFAALIGTDTTGWHYVKALRQPAVIEAIEQVLATGKPAKASYQGGSLGRETTFEAHVKQAGDAALLTLIDHTDAEVAGKMRRDFVANVSHELRTPLTALTGFIETLRGAARNDEDARDRFLGIMGQEAERMTRLVDELMALSRLEETERRKPATLVNLCDIITAASQGLSIIGQNAAVDLIFDLPDAPVTVAGDSAQLQQVIMNLVENALKYGGSGGRVIVTLHPISALKALRGKGAAITVHDFGDGIADHQIARLTERFYRVDNHRSREVGGTGLGLAIVKHIVNRHRGRLQIASALGAGTTVTVLLPAD